jgi:putative ABC transport system ATP-binding protein
MPPPPYKPSGLTKWFGEGETKTFAVRDFSFEANFGEMLFVVGPRAAARPRCSA